MKIIKSKASIDELKKMADKMFGNLVKAVIEFDSLINLRPSLKNFSRGIDSPDIRKKIIKIVNKLIER